MKVMNEQILIEALNDSLERLASGQTIEDCLRAHADVAHDLRILLEIGAATKRARADRREIAGMHSRLDPFIDDLIENTEFPKPHFRLPQGAIVMLVASFLLVLVGFFLLLPHGESQLAHGKTSTKTNRPELTQDADFTPIPTVTLSETPTLTASHTATDMPDETASPTASPTPSETASPTATATNTPSETPSPTATTCVPKAPDNWQSYQVQAGDTLFDIALQTGSTVDKLMQVNCIEDHIIVAGEMLYIPSISQSEPDSSSMQTATITALDNSNDNTVPKLSTQSSGSSIQATQGSDDHEDDHSGDSSDGESSGSS